MSKKRRITVIMPAYNAIAFLAESIESVLSQTVLPYEVLVVDNLSTDGTAEVARGFGFPVRVMSCDRLGASSARNDACKEAKGEWLAFLDSDDLWSPNTLALFLAAVEEHPDVDIVYGHVANFKESPEMTGGYPEGHAMAAQLPGTMLIRRRAFERVGPYDEQYTLGCVIDWSARAKEVGLKCVALPEVVLHRRIHASNLTKERRDCKQDYTRIVKAALDRRRKAAKGS